MLTEGEDMNQSALESPESNAETLRALAGEYINHHTSLENYFINLHIEARLLRGLGIERLSWQGRLVAGLIWFLIFLLPALILTALTGEWAGAPLASWTIVAAAMGVLAMVSIPLFGSAMRNMISWIWTLVDEGEMRRLSAWEHKWYRPQVYGAISGTLALAVIVPFYFVASHDPAAPFHAGTLYIGALLAFTVSQTIWGLVLMIPEANHMSTFKHELYLLSPADSVLVRQSLRGYNQFGTLTVLYMTIMILLFLILLPGSSRVVAPIVLSLLLIEYLCTAMAVLVPRFFLERIIRAEKEKEMKTLQVRLNDLLPRLEELTEEEYEKMQRLQETQDAIRDSPDSLLPLGEIAKVGGALLLSTITVVATAFADTLLAEWVKPFLP
jgi:hypothetical protein